MSSPPFVFFSAWGSTLAGSSRREYVKKIEAMLPYSLLLQLRAHIPLLWVDVPPPLQVKHDSIRLRIPDFILYIFFLEEESGAGEQQTRSPENFSVLV